MNTIRNLIVFNCLLVASIVCEEKKEPCFIPGLAGTYPDRLCQVEQFFEAFKKGETGTRPGRNALMFQGMRGTGKTTVAEFIAHKSGVILKYIDTRSLINDHGAWLATEIRRIYADAEKEAIDSRTPIVIVFDDIDVISKKDINGLTTQEKEAMVELCNQIKAHENNSYLLTIVAAMNFSTIDSKLIEQCDQVEFDTPNKENRLAIIKFYAAGEKDLQCSEEVLKKFARKYSDLPGEAIKGAFRYAYKEYLKDTAAKYLEEKHLKEGFEYARKHVDAYYKHSWTWKKSRGVLEYFGWL